MSGLSWDAGRVRSVPRTGWWSHVVCDNLSVHHGKQVGAWLEKHPRFRMYFTPVHCSWMNQVDLEAKVLAFIA